MLYIYLLLYHTCDEDLTLIFLQGINVFNDAQGDSKLLLGFPWPIIFKPYILQKERMLKLFSILQINSNIKTL
jgi:hypothetical protein